jgi:hypothetical protein
MHARLVADHPRRKMNEGQVRVLRKIDNGYFGLNTHGDAFDPSGGLRAQDRSFIRGESVLADLHSLSLAP